jgi:hypothetical protein
MDQKIYINHKQVADDEPVNDELVNDELVNDELDVGVVLGVEVRLSPKVYLGANAESLVRLVAENRNIHI